MKKTGGFTFIEIIVAVTLFSFVTTIAFTIFSKFSSQSVKGTSMLDSTAVSNKAYNLIQQDMLVAKRFEVREANNNPISQVDADFFNGDNAAMENENCRLIIELSDGSNIKYYQQDNSLVRETSERKENIGSDRIQKVNFLPVRNGKNEETKLFDMLFVTIEAYPETEKRDEQHKTIKIDFFAAAPL
ncbi:MAG: type II secretion system GspH family protein [Candidatus Riflebacteria bacterium]|nr:type II secretion system GspH family protein [Candidatus Riflebacteria bacterium]